MPSPRPIVPLLPGDQVWQVRAQWSYSGFQISESSWSFIDRGDETSGAEDLYVAWQASLEPHFCAGRPGGWELETVLIEDRFPQTRPPLVINYIPGLSPDSSGPGTPPQVSGLISWRTGHIGRSFRGRTFWGPMRSSDVDSDGFVSGSAREAMSDFADAMFGAFGPDRPDLFPLFAIVSRTENGAPRVPPVYSVPAFNFVVRYAKTIRKRNRTPSI